MTEALTLSSGGNLILRADSFGSSGWWLSPGSAAAPTDEVPPLFAGSVITEHVLGQPTYDESAAVFGHAVPDGLEAGAMHVGSLFVWLPSEFAGTVVGAMFAGLPSAHIVNAHTRRLGTWQRIWVAARLPPDADSANLCLYVIGPAGTRLFTTCWKLEAGAQPTEYMPEPVPESAPAPVAIEAAPPGTALATLPAEPARPTGTLYRLVGLEALARALPNGAGSRAAVERMPLLPASSLTVPAPAFGGSDLDDIVFHPSGNFAAGRLRREATPAYMIRGATLHGIDGTVTVGDQVIADTLPASLRGQETLWLPDWPVAARLQAGCHLLADAPDNYFHWLVDVLARYRPPVFDLFARSPEATSPPVLLQPPLDSAWKRQSHALAVPKSTPRLSLEPAGRIEVAHLLYVPELSGGTMNPPPALLETFDGMRASAMAGVPMRAPWRKLYLSRQGNSRRVLANEAEVAACAEAAGFALVQTETLSVADQIRLFAEASHIVAPHGAALANIGFCQPGAALCELHMASYVHQAYRSLAALRGLRYGCLVGTVEGEPDVPLFDQRWRLDVSLLEAVLRDPVFVGDAQAAGAEAEPEARGWWRRLIRSRD